MMTIVRYAFMGISFALLLVTMVTAAGHPSENYTSNELSSCYTTRSTSRVLQSFGDLTFVEAYPDPLSMTDAEKYMLAGTTDGPPEFCIDGGLPAWWGKIERIVKFYYMAHGEIPAQVTPQVYADAYEKPLDMIDPLQLELIRNPLTGEYPRTDSLELSPGDFYIKALSEEEMRHFASFDDGLYEMWFNGRAKKRDGTWGDCPISGPVLYVRLYGWHSVIKNDLAFGGVIPATEELLNRLPQTAGTTTTLLE